MCKGRGIGRSLGIALLAAAAGCSNGGSSSSTSVSNTSVSRAGAIVADPARNRVYVADVDNRRLLAFDSTNGALAASAPFVSSPEGVTSDARGSRVFVTLPSLHKIVVLDAVTFAQIQEYDSANALHAIAWRDTGRVVVASDVGLLLVDVDAATEQTIIPGAPGNALIVHDHHQRRIWAAFSLNDQLGVATIDPDLSGDTPVGNTYGPCVDPPVSFTLSFNETSLFVGLLNTAEVDVIAAATLALTSTKPMPPALVALASNVTSTRLYVSPGDPSATDVAADTWKSGADFLASNAILQNGAAVDTIGANLVVHLATSTVEALPLFADTLTGDPVVITGKPYTMTLSGPPNALYIMFGSPRPGFLHYGPPNAQPQLFLDLDPATLKILTQGQLDGDGKATFTSTLDSGTIPEGTQYFLQAIVDDPAAPGLGDPTNPMRITIFDPLP